MGIRRGRGKTQSQNLGSTGLHGPVPLSKYAMEDLQGVYVQKRKLLLRQDLERGSESSQKNAIEPIGISAIMRFLSGPPNPRTCMTPAAPPPKLVKFGKQHFIEVNCNVEAEVEEIKRKAEEARVVREQQIWKEAYDEGYAEGYAEGQRELDQLRAEDQLRAKDQLRAELDQLRAKVFAAELESCSQFMNFSTEIGQA